MPSALGIALLIGVVAFRAGDAPPDPAAALERAMARAETSLRAGRLEAAEAEYHAALREGQRLRQSLAGRELADGAALQYAYGLALVRAGRAAEAEPVFARLLARHGDTAELNVLLGQAHAQQGDYPSAIEALQRARQLKPDVAEASSTLGLIYM